MSDTDKYAARDALQALLDDYDEQIEVNAQMAEVLRNIRVPLNVPLADYVANTEAPTTSLGITDLASLLAGLAAANARVDEAEAMCEWLAAYHGQSVEEESGWPWTDAETAALVAAAREAVKR